MRRKLVKQGKGAITVSLPKKWVDLHHLKSGDEVDVEEDNRNVIISSTILKHLEKKATVDISNLHVKAIQQIIKSLYMKGFNEAKVIFNNKKTTHLRSVYLKKEHPTKRIKDEFYAVDIIRDALKDMIGFEITEEKEKSLTIKQISKVDEEEFRSSLRRVFRLFHDLNNNLLENVIEKSIDQHTLNDKISYTRKFINYSNRLIKLGVIKKDEFDLHSILKSFEDLTNIYEFLTFFMSHVRKPFEKNTIEMLKQLNQLIDFVHKAYFQFSIHKYNEFDLKLREFYHKHNTTFRKASKEDLRVRQMLTACAMDLTSIMGDILSIYVGSQATS